MHACMHACMRGTLGLHEPTMLACMQDYEPPSGAIADCIEKDFGSLDALIAKFNPMAVGVQVRACMPSALLVHAQHDGASMVQAGKRVSRLVFQREGPCMPLYRA